MKVYIVTECVLDDFCEEFYSEIRNVFQSRAKAEEFVKKQGVRWPSFDIEEWEAQ